MIRSYGTSIYPDTLTRRILAINAKADKGQAKTGFILQILTLGNNEQNVESICFGNPGNNITQINFLAGEQINRLKRRRDDGYSDTCSNMSSIPRLERFPGAIHALEKDGTNMYLSVAGLDPELSEALAYCVADGLGLQVDQTYRNKFLRSVRQKIARSILAGA